jgi:hypothetical protein
MHQCVFLNKTIVLHEVRNDDNIVDTCCVSRSNAVYEL